MIGILRVALLNLVFLMPLAYAACLPAGADLTTVPGYISSYSATISDQDRQNSSGQQIEGMKAFLQQDRANVNRFNRGDPQDEKDNFFITPQNRQLFLSASYAGRCGRDYVELVKAIEQRGQNTPVNVHIVREASNLTLYVELVNPTVSAQAVATSSPSFDCSKASTVVEGSICANNNLSDLDIQLSGAYKKARSVSSDPAALRNEQLAWMKSRNSCGANVDCLTQSYLLRLSELGSGASDNVTPPKPKSIQPSSPNALAFVMNKKWSLEELSCDLNGGTYQVFTRNAPLGYVFFAGGQSTQSNNPQAFQFIEKNSNEFTHIGKIGANETVRSLLRSSDIVVAEIRTDVKLVNPKKIEYKKTIKQIDFDLLMKGRVLYNTVHETGFGNLCQ